MSGAEKIYYHGTWDGYAYSIMTQGFKLGREFHGQLLGRGLYIAQQPASTVFWSYHTVFKCRLQPGTRILWIQDGYDRRVIDYLGREFGQALLDLGPHFHKAIPANKQLTGWELRHLCNYIFQTRRDKKWQYGLSRAKGKKSQFFDAWDCLSRLHQQVKRHGYDALGDRSFAQWDSDEILVFNPSRVTPISAHRLLVDDDWNFVGLSPPLSLDEVEAISVKAQLEDDE